MSERPDTVHGRLLEAVHISGYSFERACAELEWLLDEDRWRQIGFEDGAAFVESVMGAFSAFRMAAEQKKKLAKKLTRVASQRAVAKVLGVGKTTVQRATADVGPSGPATPPEVAQNAPEKEDSGPNGPLPPSQFKVDPAQAAKTPIKRKAKDAERQQKRDENAAKVVAVPNLSTVGAVFPTVVIDPPWAWEDEGDHEQLGRGRHTYKPMTFEELLAFPVGARAADNSHLYLWITNRSMPKGFALMERWGFRFVTILTWVKPSFGMGNYFRGQTEHVLFGVKGSLPLLRKDAGTVFQAPRGPNGHSSKPVEFYDLVESCSPGPYLEIFSRSQRVSWVTHGEDGISLGEQAA
jgi:N6-adenosine-specific RNA methylase IME4